MVKRPVVTVATHSFVGLSQAGYQNAFDDMASQGFGPFIITATGPGASAVFAGSFRQMSHIPLTRSNLSKDQFIDLNRAQHDAGAMLLWADVFGAPADPRYCAIWVANPERIAWNIDAVDEGGAALQQRFEAMAGTLARPAIIAVTPAARIMELYVDSQIGPWASRAGMTSADYQTEFTHAGQRRALAGLRLRVGRRQQCPLRGDLRDAGRTSAALSSDPPAVPRWRRSTRRCRSTSRIRICAAPRSPSCRARACVYARGYTFAEASPAYHDIQPATPFRQASISKTFCAVACGSWSSRVS